MAKKKTVAEPQEEQFQALGLSGEGTVTGEDTVIPTEGTMPEGGEIGGEPADFLATDELSFGDVSGGNTSPEDAEPDVDGTTGDIADGGGDEPAMEDKDYDAFLQAVSEGGGVEPVSPLEPTPLLLEESAGGDGGGDLPPMSEEDVPEAGKPAAEDPAPARIEDRRSFSRRERERVLTIDPRAEVQTQEDLEDLIWHELQNANRTRHSLTGKLDSVGRTQNGMDVAVVLYKGVQVLVPLKEMMVHAGPVPSGPEYALWVDQVTRILHARQNSDIDFVVRGMDNESRTVVGSRRDAMYRKRKRFYLDTDEQGRHMIEEGRTVQARVVAVADKVIRVEVFGVECNVTARGSSRMWLGSAREAHYVGELILVRVRKIERVNVDRITIQVDARSVFGEDGDNLSQCRPQRRYVGQVTDVRRGVVFVRLNIGVNAIAHTCYDMRMPGRKDTVSFTVTRLDEEKGIAIGIITRIIKQNL